MGSTKWLKKKLEKKSIPGNGFSEKKMLKKIPGVGGMATPSGRGYIHKHICSLSHTHTHTHTHTDARSQNIRYFKHSMILSAKNYAI